MGFLNKLFGRKDIEVNWDEIKSTDKIYPQGSFSILMVTTEDGKPGTGWVDAGYVNYDYKKYCPYNFSISVDLTDSVAEKNPDLDMGSVEDYFTIGLRKVCIAHIVSRIVTTKGMLIEYYLDDFDAGKEYLKSIIHNPERLVSFTVEIDKDPGWKRVEKVMRLH